VKLTPASRLTIRVASDHIGEFLTLIGATLDVDGATVRVEAPEMLSLRPALRVYSRLVVIKGFMEPEGLLAAATRQMKASGIQGTLGLPYRAGTTSVEGRPSKVSPDPLQRRTLDICGKQIVGYAVLASELTADESIVLQEKGLGGRRRFGCGIFVPATE
jgi:CRISPR-associated protein Cas6